MNAFLSTSCVTLLLCIAYLRAGRSIAAKRWLLPATAAGMAAILAACFATYAAPGMGVGYAVGLPLGLSAGCLLHHILDYCQFCGSAHSMRRTVDMQPHRSAGPQRCHRCREAFRR